MPAGGLVLAGRFVEIAELFLRSGEMMRTAILLSLIAFFVTAASAFGAETCAEGCTTADESGVIFFERDNGEKIQCCCVIPDSGGNGESRPIEECTEATG